MAPGFTPLDKSVTPNLASLVLYLFLLQGRAAILKLRFGRKCYNHLQAGDVFLDQSEHRNIYIHLRNYTN